MKCEKCGWEGQPNLEETGPHTKALCRGCGKYIKMVSKKELEKMVMDSLKDNHESHLAFKITKCNIPRGCSACYTEDPDGWCIKDDVVLIETFSAKMYLCAHHVKVLTNLLKQL